MASHNFTVNIQITAARLSHQRLAKKLMAVLDNGTPREAIYEAIPQANRVWFCLLDTESLLRAIVNDCNAFLNDDSDISADDLLSAIRDSCRDMLDAVRV